MNLSGTSEPVTKLPQYLEVAVPLHVHQTFTYKLPREMQEDACIGSRVLVPFGQKPITGYIVDLQRDLGGDLQIAEREIKEVIELFDDEPLFSSEILELTKWIAEFYRAPWGEILRGALPSGLNATVEQILAITSSGVQKINTLPQDKKQSKSTRLLSYLARSGEIKSQLVPATIVKQADLRTIARELFKQKLISITYRKRSSQARPKKRKFVRFRNNPTTLLSESERKLTPAGSRVFDTLSNHDGDMAFTELVEKAETSASTVQTLVKNNLLEVYVRDVRRDPLAQAVLPKPENLTLTEWQRNALDTIHAALAEHQYKTILLHGVTGSGKTEVYLRAMRQTLESNRSALMLVPEIALTPVFSRQLRANFADEVAILHSSLSTGERFDEWNRIKNGEARVVIGTRSAVFAPLANLGLIIVDEEHDSSYRQQESPHYNARDTAIMRARMRNAVVLLGSATPSLESFYNAKKNKYQYLLLPERIAGSELAHVEVIDMRKVFARQKTGKRPVFSEEVLAAIEETYHNSRQSMVLLNRRGFANFLICRSCGESIECPNCSVTLTYHQTQQRLICHYCNYNARVPEQCPICNGTYIYYVGEGTEQIEEILKVRFPQMRIARLDRDTMSRRHTFEQVILGFAEGEIDLLVGTQMIAKGHHFPNVTLVSVISVDSGLHLPDFRSAERTFQLLTQVSGRAGRGMEKGRVLIQTFHPEHYAIRHACHQDYACFYNEEIHYRERMNYPPFVALAMILVHATDQTRAQSTASTLRAAFDETNQDQMCRVLGPAPAPLERLRGEHRLQLFVKSRSRNKLRQLIDMALNQAEEKGCDLRMVNV
ncbi:MAG: primosomal protein N', partial [Pyrinomonadaceae bacterium]